MDSKWVWKLGFKTIRELETERGILASGHFERFGVIFGRDSLISDLLILQAYKKHKDPYFLELVKKSLLNLVLLQGKEVNIESGEEPGKCIHEYRPDNHKHLTASSPKHKAWFTYPNGEMRNYDTADATPLLAIACYRYYALTKDDGFLGQVLPGVRSALDWIMEYGDHNGDGFIDAGIHPERNYGGLDTQNWMDSSESVFFEDGSKAIFPIAYSEVQAYAYMALRLWGRYFVLHDPHYALRLNNFAGHLKDRFNEKFILGKGEDLYLAPAIDGSGAALDSVRSSMGHVLWASMRKAIDGVQDSILEAKYVKPIVGRLMAEDMFEPEAGVRTLSTKSKFYKANSYHNGSIWPHDNAIISLGLANFHYYKAASRVATGTLKAIRHFGTPIELFVYDDGYKDYIEGPDSGACKYQAWAAAAIMSFVAKDVKYRRQAKTSV